MLLYRQDKERVKEREVKTMMMVWEAEWYGDYEVYMSFAFDVVDAYDEKVGLESLQEVAEEWGVAVESVDVEKCQDDLYGWDD